MLCYLVYSWAFSVRFERLHFAVCVYGNTAHNRVVVVVGDDDFVVWRDALHKVVGVAYCLFDSLVSLGRYYAISVVVLPHE